MRDSVVKKTILLQGAVLLFSVSGVCIKLAGQHAVRSLQFMLFYGFALFIMGIYAVLWQQILRSVPLTTAYANRAVTVVWSMLWGALLFQEDIRWNMIFGAGVIMSGIYLVVTADG